MAIDAVHGSLEGGAEASPELVPQESRRAIKFVDGRGFMPGFLRGPLPQNYESTHVAAEGGCVAAQVLDYDPATNSCRVNVKNPFCMDDTLELMTPSGMCRCEVDSLLDFRGAAADRLNPGTEGRVLLQGNVLKDTEKAVFGFFVKNITARESLKT
jgi:putative protease